MANPRFTADKYYGHPISPVKLVQLFEYTPHVTKDSGKGYDRHVACIIRLSVAHLCFTRTPCLRPSARLPVGPPFSNS